MYCRSSLTTWVAVLISHFRMRVIFTYLTKDVHNYIMRTREKNTVNFYLELYFTLWRGL